ncbi:hypothetical protein KY284_035910 [Solanum tuberosum]|nr:hypothetical protein KY284_035910 [Solanum tuberosum]
MTEEIIERLHQFTLTEEEKETVSIEISDVLSSTNDCEVSLFGKVVSDKKVDLQGVKNTMPVAWGNPTGLQIKEIGWNFFQFKFKDKEGMNKVLFGTPWLYDKFLLNIQIWEPGLKSTSSIFNVCELWVQVWNIPLHWMSMDVGRKIGNALGGIVDIVIPENGSKEGQYIRPKARMNITKPLPRGHNEKTCAHRAKDVQDGTVKTDQFGIWLKAENHASFSEKHRQQGTNSTNGSPVVNGRRVERIVNRKEITGLSWKDNDVLNREDSNQMQPMEVTNYGSHGKEFGGGRNNVGEDNYVGITTSSKHVLNMASKKNDMSSQTSANANMSDGTTREKDDTTQINSKEVQDNIHQVLTAPEMMDVHTKTTTEQEDKDQNDTSNATLDEGVVLAECMQFIREKRKGDTELPSDIIFLSETKNKDIIVKRVQRQLNMPYATIVDPVGLSGGLSLFWNDKVQEVGGRSREVASFKDFKNFLWNLGAVDLGFKGKPWTWWCFRENDGIIQERLDRAIVSPGWRLEFHLAQIIHLNTEASDHSALLLNTDPKPIRKKRRFYFDKRWSEKDAVNNLVTRSWQEQVDGFEQSKVSFKLKKCRASLMSWLRRGKGNSKQRIIGIKSQIDKLKNDPDHFDLPKLRLLRKELGSRHIVDNVVLAHECIHVLKNKRRGNDKFMALKLDMAKAYDRVEWIYVQSLLLQMGFHDTFISWIMQCITTPTYKFNINGEIVGAVRPSRGLRQGDPLFPYLFILCAEGLSRLLNQAKEQGELRGISLRRGGPTDVPQQVLGFGKVLCGDEICCNKEFDGEQEMEKTLRFGVILGFLIRPVSNPYKDIHK